jgi:hypothetical protein
VTIGPLKISSSQATLIQTPAPTRLDLKTRLAEQAKDGVYNLVAARVGLNDSNVLGGLRTNAELADANNKNPIPEQVTATNARGGSFIDSTARLDVANYALSSPVAQDIQRNLRDTSRAKDIERSDNGKQVSKGRSAERALREDDSIQRALFAEDLAKDNAAQKTANTPQPETIATAPASDYAAASSSYNAASTSSASSSTNPTNTVTIAI